MQNKKLSIKLAIIEAWQAFKRQPKFFIFSLGLPFVATIFPFLLINEETQETITAWYVLLTIFIAFGLIVLSAYLVKICLTSIRENRIVSFQDKPKEIFKIIGKLVISGLLIFVGAGVLIGITMAIIAIILTFILKGKETTFLLPILFVLVGTIGYVLVYTTFVFIQFVVIDNYKNKIGQNIRYCFVLTKGNKMRILGLVIIISVLSTLGVITFFVGYIFTIPFSFLLMSSAYEQLRKQAIPIEDVSSGVLKTTNTV